MKVVSKTKFSRDQDKKVHFKELRLEIDILRKMKHENIITLYEVFETLNELFIVMEVCEGGELFVRTESGNAVRESRQGAEAGQGTHKHALRALCLSSLLQDRIKAQPAGSYSEMDAQQVLRQICTGLAYLHKHKIAHCVSFLTHMHAPPPPPRDFSHAPICSEFTIRSYEELN